MSDKDRKEERMEDNEFYVIKDSEISIKVGTNFDLRI